MRGGLMAGWLLVAGMLPAAPAQGCGTLEASEPERPLPSVDRVLSGLIERGALEREQQQAFTERYAHVRTRVREERNLAGRLRQRTEERKFHDPTEPARDSSAKGSNYGERYFPVTDDLLERFTYEIEGREESQGRTVVRVSFRPASDDLPQRNVMDRFINRTAGTLWLDESTFALVKARLALLEEVSFFVGIAGVVHALEATFERASTPDGLWYTRRSAWRVDFRQFLVRKIVEFEERRDEVRPVEQEPELESG